MKLFCREKAEHSKGKRVDFKKAPKGTRGFPRGLFPTWLDGYFAPRNDYIKNHAKHIQSQCKHTVLCEKFTAQVVTSETPSETRAVKCPPNEAPPETRARKGQR